MYMVIVFQCYEKSSQSSKLQGSPQFCPPVSSDHHIFHSSNKLDRSWIVLKMGEKVKTSESWVFFCQLGSTGLQDVQQGYLSTVQCEANKNGGRAKLLDLLLLLVTTKTLCFYKGSTWGLFVVCRSIMWRTLWQFWVPVCSSVQFVVCLLVCLVVCNLLFDEEEGFSISEWNVGEIIQSQSLTQ